ncbi:hypothetical protein niasHT_021884 [Heterodera trifolii]|uniref:Hexosyltransferase n=1 Tax=Heterodera trifolii TaxID=157864 RepID=A0ABD2JCF7_9BILA
MSIWLGGASVSGAKVTAQVSAAQMSIWLGGASVAAQVSAAQVSAAQIVLICYPALLQRGTHLDTFVNFKVKRAFTIGSKEDNPITSECAKMMAKNGDGNGTIHWRGIKLRTVPMPTNISTQLSQFAFVLETSIAPNYHYNFGKNQHQFSILFDQNQIGEPFTRISITNENASFTLDENAMQKDFLANIHQNGLAFLADYAALWLLGVDMMQMMNKQQEMKLFISRGSNCTMEALMQGQFPLLGVVRFLIADPSPQGEADNVQQKMNEEQKKHGDLLLLRGFVDKYLNLHFKSYGGFVWQQRHCANAKWMLKMDDDTVIHLPRMAHWIENKFRHIATKHPLLFVGVGGHRTPVRDPNGPYKKWYVSREMYAPEMYPPFVVGGGYMATTDTVKAILAQTHKINVLYLEDVMYTGILGELANATVLDQKQDHFWFPYQSENEVRQFWHSKTLKCVGGVPTLFAVFAAKDRTEIVQNFEELKKMSCK